MTPELQQRLDRSLAPFDSVCIHNNEDITLSTLREILAAAVIVAFTFGT